MNGGAGNAAGTIIRCLRRRTRRQGPSEPAVYRSPLATLAGRNGPVRREHTRRSTRDINTVITTKDRSERRWWLRNGDVIRYLDEGRTVREISALIGRGQRQIRVIRERLSDIRACELEVSRAANTI